MTDHRSDDLNGDRAELTDEELEKEFAEMDMIATETPRAADQEAEIGAIIDALDALDLSADDDSAETGPVTSLDALEELVLSAPEVTAEPEDVIEDDADTESLDPEEQRALELDLLKVEAYEAEAGEVAATAPVTPLATTPAKTPKAPRAAATPRTPRDLSALPDDAFQLFEGSVPNPAAVRSLRPTQKKVAEKFDNLFLSLHAGKKPMNYTLDLFKVLEDLSGTATSEQLVKGLMGKPKSDGSTYSIGTARSQVGQIMTLFATVGIATRTGQTITLKPNSVLAAKMRKLIA